MSARFTAQYLTPDRGTGASLGEAVLFSTRGMGQPLSLARAAQR